MFLGVREMVHWEQMAKYCVRDCVFHLIRGIIHLVSALIFSKNEFLVLWYSHFFENFVCLYVPGRRFLCNEAATRGVLWKKVFLEISQYSQENTCARVSFIIKLQASGQQLY